MLFAEPKNVFFVEIPLHPNISLRSSGLPYFYSVKLDIIGFGQKEHFCNRETSCIKVLYVISHELDDVHLGFFKMTRAKSLDTVSVFIIKFRIDLERLFVTEHCQPSISHNF